MKIFTEDGNHYRIEQEAKDRFQAYYANEKNKKWVALGSPRHTFAAALNELMYRRLSDGEFRSLSQIQADIGSFIRQVESYFEEHSEYLAGR
ncbi:hypothetical protein [Lonepinella sp. BR2919]|uniref:hypothetical protein n=1 Tax=unclassified Lonepinella TaxID=2642006 RepID=UPI003F6DD06D